MNRQEILNSIKEVERKLEELEIVARHDRELREQRAIESYQRLLITLRRLLPLVHEGEDSSVGKHSHRSASTDAKDDHYIASTVESSYLSFLSYSSHSSYDELVELNPISEGKEEKQDQEIDYKKGSSRSSKGSKKLFSKSASFYEYPDQLTETQAENEYYAKLMCHFIEHPALQDKFHLGKSATNYFIKEIESPGTSNSSSHKPSTDSSNNNKKNKYLYVIPRNVYNIRNLYLELYSMDFQLMEWLDKKEKGEFSHWNDF